MVITEYQKMITPVRINGTTAHGAVYKISETVVAKIPFNRNLAKDVVNYEFEMAKALIKRGIRIAKPLEVGTVVIEQGGKNLAYIMEFVDGKGFYELPSRGNQRKEIAEKYHEEMQKAINEGFDFGYERDTNYTNFLIDKEGKVKLIDFVTWTHPKVPRPATLGELF